MELFKKINQFLSYTTHHSYFQEFYPDVVYAPHCFSGQNIRVSRLKCGLGKHQYCIRPSRPLMLFQRFFSQLRETLQGQPFRALRVASESRGQGTIFQFPLPAWVVLPKPTVIWEHSQSPVSSHTCLGTVLVRSKGKKNKDPS